MLPDEIWEKILKEIKRPEDLGRLKLVCMNWNIIIEKIFQHHIQWKKYCSEKIPEKCMFHLVDQITELPIEYDSHLPYIRMEFNKIWREIYYYWKTWPLSIDHQVFIDKLNNLPLITTNEQITHLDVYRDYLGIVTNENSIYFYKISDLQNTYYKVYNATTAVVQFIFWKTETEEILALTRSATGLIKFSDVTNKVGGEYILEGDFISVYREKCHIINGLNVTKVKYKRTSQVLVPVKNYMAKENPYKEFKFLKLSKLGFFHYSSCNLCTTTENQLSFTSQKFYSVEEDLVVAISNSKICFRFMKNKWREYNLFNNLHGRVQYFCYHCKMLIFGLDSGVIYIFHLKKISDLENFDFSPTNGRKIIVDTQPIIAIRVVDFEKRKIIIAATHKNVHFINFLSS